MKIKTPMVLDTSGYNYGSDFTKVPGLAGIYCKASEGYYTRDRWFVETWAQAKRLGIPKAAYHFYRERWFGFPRDPIPQARLFVEMIESAGGLVPGDLVIIDAEDSYMTIGKILTLGREIRRLLNRWPLIYTGYYYIKDNMHGFDELTEADIEDLKKMSLIISCYPVNPDLYSSLPSQYVPDQDYFGKVVGWQYAGDESPTQFGWTSVRSSIDLNLFEETFFNMWKESYELNTEPPVVEPHPDDADNTGESVLSNYTINNNLGVPTNYHILSVDLSKFDIITDAGFNFMTTDRWLKSKEADFAINGLTGWYVGQERRRFIAYLDGVAYSGGRGSGKWGVTQTLFMSKDNKFSLDRPKNIWNAYGFPNLLIKDGIILPTTKSTLDIRARTAIGVNKDQTRLYLMTVDGGDYWERIGMNFQQVALILRELGCDLAVMSDGGGSTTMVKRNAVGDVEVIGKPSGEEPIVIGGVTYHMRPVAVHFGLKARNK